MFTEFGEALGTHCFVLLRTTNTQEFKKATARCRSYRLVTKRLRLQCVWRIRATREAPWIGKRNAPTRCGLFRAVKWRCTSPTRRVAKTPSRVKNDEKRHNDTCVHHIRPRRKTIKTRKWAQKHHEETQLRTARTIVLLER